MIRAYPPRLGLLRRFRYTGGCVDGCGTAWEVGIDMDTSQRWFWIIFISLSAIGFLSQLFMAH